MMNPSRQWESTSDCPLSFLLADQQLISRCPKSGAVTTMVLITPLPIEDASRAGQSIPTSAAPALPSCPPIWATPPPCSAQPSTERSLPLTKYHHPYSRR
ncbi:hypothetical protein PGT21_027714 [Puccinia graminis f. sp. tritici]|uniref:Uncharacterized protein n=1 Tax=Puccinia graminis f. sp. tritici TaxID=56615 RepID=A0A5B0P821_PUCGR|nr:hypothetical protein PGT21_027714 [Puccinia graminis f. sp. tritici]